MRERERERETLSLLRSRESLGWERREGRRNVVLLSLSTHDFCFDNNNNNLPAALCSTNVLEAFLEMISFPIIKTNKYKKNEFFNLFLAEEIKKLRFAIFFCADPRAARATPWMVFRWFFFLLKLGSPFFFLYSYYKR